MPKKREWSTKPLKNFFFSWACVGVLPFPISHLKIKWNDIMHYVWRWLISTKKPAFDSLPCQTHAGGRLLGVGWSVGGDSPGAGACWAWNSPEWTFGSGWCKQGRPWRRRCVDRQLLCNLSVCLSQWRPPARRTESHFDFEKQNYSQSGSHKIKTFLSFIFR